MQSGYVSSFLGFVRQHEEMKNAILKIQRMIECFRDRNHRMLSENLISKLEKITALTIHHIEREEREIMPILKQLYDPQTDIAQYMEKQHNYITAELLDLVNCLQPYRNAPIHLNDEQFIRIQVILEEIMVHFFEEENGLFPLLQSYLQSN